MSPIALIVVVGIFVVAAFLFFVYPRKASAAYPYVRKRLFSPAERSFLGALNQAVGGEYRIFAKIRVGDIVEPDRALSNSRRQSAFNRTSGKHFDFVLCTTGELDAVCAVELDDRSHQLSSRHDRDTFLEGVCNGPCGRTSSTRSAMNQSRCLTHVTSPPRNPGQFI